MFLNTNFSTERINRFVMPLILIAAVLSSTALGVRAQEPSTDRKNPTPFTSNSVEGEYDGAATTHYFRFVANKGEVTVSIHAKTKAYSSLVDVELLDEAGRSLEKFSLVANEAGRTEARTRNFIKSQPVIVKVFMREDKDIQHLKYEVELSGAVQLAHIDIGGGVPPVVGERAPTKPDQAGQRMGLPSSGTLVISMSDGQMHEFDLKTVKKISVKP